MTPCMALLLCLILILVTWNLVLASQVRASDFWSKISDRQMSELKAMADQVHALRVQLEIRNRKPPKKPKLDTALVKQRLISGINEAFRDG